MSIDKYLRLFKKLNVNNSLKKTKGSVAPHKPILLLSVIKLIEDGVITSSEIYLSPELLATFKHYWDLLANKKYHREITQPFFYLRSSDFWTLEPNPGHEDYIASRKAIKSFNQLSIRVACAHLAEDLFQLLQNPQHRNDLRQVLLDTYLAYNKHYFTQELNYQAYINEVSTSMVEEDFATYQAHLQQKRTRLKTGSPERERVEEEEFLRTKLFPETILKLYKHTCCVSRFKVTISPTINRQVSMVEGCHIEPFHVNGNNSVNNGMALTYTIHKAFDKGLIAIDDNYRIMVANTFEENLSSPYNLRQFEQQEILLPNSPQYYPSQQALRAHRLKFGFQ